MFYNNFFEWYNRKMLGVEILDFVNLQNQLIFIRFKGKKLNFAQIIAQII